MGRALRRLGVKRSSILQLSATRSNGRVFHQLRLLLPGKDEPNTTDRGAALAAHQQTSDEIMHRFRRVLTHHSRKVLPGRYISSSPKSRRIRVYFPLARNPEKAE